MTADELEAIRRALGHTQQIMADRLACDYVGYKRYETGARAIPRYVARSATLLLFINQNGLQEKLEELLTK
ncbi:transcriptional regulator [Paracidovorax avenae]|uniref:transcriptional regulator n=1 Tax=Paracidovorax avenae TaxID=80867 RepID=UPI000D21F9F5|nr:transcriptional regulator [Paracidovorax avenae]AVS67407.1 transcriptional regulator [Paracidovorax avenae]